ncbi:aminotransferase class I/II-fold pyridoxal phosphate-dependent enzyme [Streptomyces sp. NBC_00445]|uniref:aminotransferase class I/II-fold pyridoxal phosphate-dependent enzyme n=1 Tax=Streptomyces sp. NBC_00445 TaxID=2975745 RepID=UPI002E1AE807
MPHTDQTTPLYQYSQLTADAQNVIMGGGILSGEIATFDGKLIPDLDRRVADLTGRTQALAVDSGSSALLLAMRGLEIGPGHEVIIPELRWVSIGAAADMLDATVRVAPATDSLTPTWDQIEPLITHATRAVVLVHLRGRPAPGIADITRRLFDRGIALTHIRSCRRRGLPGPTVVAHQVRPSGAPEHERRAQAGRASAHHHVLTPRRVHRPPARGLAALVCATRALNRSPRRLVVSQVNTST